MLEGTVPQATRVVVLKAGSNASRIRKRATGTSVPIEGGKTPGAHLAELDMEDRAEATSRPIDRNKMTLDLDVIKQRILERYVREEKKELTMVVAQERSAELARQAAWKLQSSREDKLKRSIAACTVIAADDGRIVHATTRMNLTARPRSRKVRPSASGKRYSVLQISPDYTSVSKSTGRRSTASHCR